MNPVILIVSLALATSACDVEQSDVDPPPAPTRGAPPLGRFEPPSPPPLPSLRYLRAQRGARSATTAAPPPVMERSPALDPAVRFAGLEASIASLMRGQSRDLGQEEHEALLADLRRQLASLQTLQVDPADLQAARDAVHALYQPGEEH